MKTNDPRIYSGTPQKNIRLKIRPESSPIPEPAKKNIMMNEAIAIPKGRKSEVSNFSTEYNGSAFSDFKCISTSESQSELNWEES
jgi:hypothetical protein